MKRIISITSTLFFLLLSSAFAETQQIAAECTTKGTDWDGSRNSCRSGVSKVTAPANHVFAEKSLSGGMTSGAGSEKDCILKWHDYIEVIPGTGIKQPRTVTLQAKARSPEHDRGARGWAKCKYTVNVVKYK